MTNKETMFRFISSRATVGLAILAFFLVPAPLTAQDHGYCPEDGHRHEAPRRYRDHHRKRYRDEYRDYRRGRDYYRERDHYEHDYRKERRNDYGHYYHRGRHYEVPRKLSRKQRHRLRRFYHSKVYHRGHDHYHSVYRLPYRTHRGTAYRPYAYCKGDFFATGRFTVRGPLFDISLRF